MQVPTTRHCLTIANYDPWYLSLLFCFVSLVNESLLKERERAKAVYVFCSLFHANMND